MGAKGGLAGDGGGGGPRTCSPFSWSCTAGRHAVPSPLARRSSAAAAPRRRVVPGLLLASDAFCFSAASDEAVHGSRGALVVMAPTRRIKLDLIEEWQFCS